MIEDNLERDMESIFPESEDCIDGGTFEFYSTASYETWNAEATEGNWNDNDLWF